MSLNRNSSRDSPSELRIYLMSNDGTLLWSNTNTLNVNQEDEALLHTAFISALSSFAKEFISEDLKELKINDIYVSLFPIFQDFYVALFMEESIRRNTKNLIQQFEDKINNLLFDQSNVFEADLDILLPITIAVLSDFDEQIRNEQVESATKFQNLSFQYLSFHSILEELIIGFQVYTLDGVLLFKYFPERFNRIMNFERVSSIVSSLLRSPKQLDSMYMIIDNIGVYFFIYKNLVHVLYSIINTETLELKNNLQENILSLKRSIIALLRENENNTSKAKR